MLIVLRGPRIGRRPRSAPLSAGSSGMGRAAVVQQPPQAPPVLGVVSLHRPPATPLLMAFSLLQPPPQAQSAQGVVSLRQQPQATPLLSRSRPPQGGSGEEGRGGATRTGQHGTPRRGAVTPHGAAAHGAPAAAAGAWRRRRSPSRCKA